MGNKLGRRRQIIDEKFTRPQGLYHHRDVDHKKLKKLILESKLAPCYPGDEECACNLEECPICFLYYPSLNRSRCCMKGICTECFLQMKVPNSARPTQCPFCKTSNYAVEYRGVKTKEEKGLEQIEEQRVIEAKIRMRQQELQDEEERMQKRHYQNSLSTNVESMEISDNSFNASRCPVEDDEIDSSMDFSAAQVLKPLTPPTRPSREDEFDLDLEDIMVMEAIWLSIQENGRQQPPPSFVHAALPRQYVAEDRYISAVMSPVIGASSSSSPSGGLACAIASLAERQQMGGEASANLNPEGMSSYSMDQGTSRFYHRMDRDAENYPSAVSISDISLDRIVLTRDDREWSVDHGSEVAEAGTSYASSVATEDISSISAVPPSDQFDSSLNNIPEPIVPETYEEQMMLAMAVSLAEARAMSNGQGVSWQ